MKRWYSLGLGAVAGVSSLLSTSVPSQAQPQLQLDATPPLDEVIPFQQPIELSVQAVDGSTGVSLDDATIQVRLLAPAKTPWLTTDFPIVEGTTLLDSAIAAPNGEATLQLMPPIRGNYQLEVTVSPVTADAFAPFTETLEFRIPENPVRYRNAAILVAILLAAGFGGGWVIGGSQKLADGEIAPQPVRLLLSAAMLVAIASLLYISITAELADAHSNHGSAPPSQVEKQPHPDSLTVSLNDLAIAQVGQTIPLEVAIADAATGQPLTDINLQIATHIQDYGQTVLAFSATPDATGTYTWDQQFFDGSPHTVTVQVAPQPDAAVQFEPFELVKQINVNGIEPPMSVRLISLSYLVAFLAAGVGAGFWTRRRFQDSTP